jgi:ribosomal protein S18 acetylase RimI-like enzyme
MSRLAQLDGMQMRAMAGPAASVYGAAMKRPPEVVIQRREIIAGHTTYPGFLCVAAFDTADDAPDPTSGDLVGFGYGYLGAGGQWWHDTVSQALGRDGSRRWLRDGFELAELHVLPEHQGAGLGRKMLTDVLSRTTARHAVLSTPDTESPARLLYRSYGFEDLVCGFYFPGSSECYAIMGVDL